MKKLGAVISAAAFLAGLGVASAQTGDRVTTRDRVGKNAGRQFNKQDLDRSGAIEKAEWDRHTEEVIARIRARMQKRFDDADVNRDGRISREEFVAARMKWFGEVDANQDGVIDRGELRKDQRSRARQERRETR